MKKLSTLIAFMLFLLILPTTTSANANDAVLENVRFIEKLTDDIGNEFLQLGSTLIDEGNVYAAGTIVNNANSDNEIFLALCTKNVYGNLKKISTQTIDVKAHQTCNFVMPSIESETGNDVYLYAFYKRNLCPLGDFYKMKNGKAVAIPQSWYPELYRDELEYYPDITKDAYYLDISPSVVFYLNGIPDDSDNISNAHEILVSAIDDYDYNRIDMLINKYDVVKSIDIDDDIIYGLKDNIDLSQRSYSISIDGKVVSLSELRENDVLSIVTKGNESIDTADYIDILVSRKTVSGMITEKAGGSDEPYEFKIGDRMYVGADESVNFSLGVTTTFLLTSDNKIIGAKVITDKQYGFVTSTKESESEDGKYNISIINTDGNLASYPISSSVKVTTSDGVSGIYSADDNGQDIIFGFNSSLGKAISTKETLTETQASIKYRFITFILNDDNEISEIYFAKTSSQDSFNVNEFTGLYNRETNKLDNYGISENAKLFTYNVSQLKENSFMIKESDISVIDFSRLDESTSYSGYVFDVDFENQINAVVLFDCLLLPPDEKIMATVKGITYGQNSMGTEKDGLIILHSGEERYVFLNNDTSETLSDISKGDIVKFQTDINGDLQDVVKIFDVSDRKLCYTYDSETEYGFVYGITTGVSGENIVISNNLYNGEKVSYNLNRKNQASFTLVDEAKRFTKSYVTSLESSALLNKSNSVEIYTVILQIDKNLNILEGVQYKLEDEWYYIKDNLPEFKLYYGELSENNQ